ncbi:putative ferric-chelate reductase 1 homolog isoform X2 [Eurytemora carolleeae]|nr:putative ferric-chelate reductase 1 homolog isoform X2 [Eurytemora carolleeae]XP_023333944.1 putative ferric-chelate reductase 1 homolog isoform X2 [Eurytemora carolleeae]|eukprot:XP_023333943.1 putative ferric-chelate reductase 1 homolog isoform X2 [Eurytemora affinis]
MYTWKRVGDKMEWESYRKGTGYTAIGVSKDSKMGEDIMFVCSQAGVKEYVATGRVTPNLITDNAPSLISKSSVNGEMYCKFQSGLKLAASSASLTMDLSTTSFYLLLAKGDGEMSYHTQFKASTASPVSLNTVGGVYSESKIMIQLHGLFMVVAWVGCAGIGKIIAKHFKQTWKGSKVFGADVWFQLHRTLMTLVVLFTIIGLILIMVYEGGWHYTAEEIRKNPHPALGLVVVILSLIQPVMAAFRPAPGKSCKRMTFFVFHSMFGAAAFALSMTTLFQAQHLDDLSLTFQGFAVPLIVYVVGYGATQIILTIQSCFNKNEREEIIDEDAPGSAIRKIVLLGFTLLSIAVAISLVVAIFQSA